MGKSRAVTYRLEIRVASGARYTPMEWRVRDSRTAGRGCGKPTSENVGRWVAGFEESMRTGPNRHLGADTVTFARIIDQRTGEVVARWERSPAPEHART